MSSIMLIKELSDPILIAAYLEMIELGPYPETTKEPSFEKSLNFPLPQIGYHKIPFFSRFIPESCFLIVLGIGKFNPNSISS